MKTCSKCSLEYNEIHGIAECPACYGSTGELTLAEIGEVLGCTRERVRQLEASGLRKLKRPDSIRNREFRDDLNLFGYFDDIARQKKKARDLHDPKKQGELARRRKAALSDIKDKKRRNFDMHL